MAKHEDHKKQSNKGKATGTPYLGLFPLILCCFFVSGLTGLTYEILWTRMIVKIIGTSPFAVSIVLTVFMGGLGLGSYLGGADHRSHQRTAETGEDLRFAGVVHRCLWIRSSIAPSGDSSPSTRFSTTICSITFSAYNLLTFVGCALLLIVPVTCMGATLPILSRFFVTSLSRWARAWEGFMV